MTSDGLLTNWRNLGRYVLNGNQGAGAAHIFFVTTGSEEDLGPVEKSGDLEEQQMLWLGHDALSDAIQKRGLPCSPGYTDDV